MINHLIKMHAHQTIQTIHYEWEKNLKTELWKCGIKIETRKVWICYHS